MSTLRQYCERMSSEQIEAQLRDNLEGKNHLPVGELLMMGAILVDRDCDSLDACQLFQQILDRHLYDEIKNGL